MDFRRNGLLDERRRRVLIDETRHANNSQDASSGETTPGNVVRSPAKPYTEAAIAGSQTPITYFLPKRPLLTWVVWLMGMSLVAGIELLYRYVYLAASNELRGSLSALDVEARGSLAGWLAGVVLGISALGSLLIYQIRRHRTDDYRGRYRWWLWLVPLLLMLSVNATTGLHEVLSGVLTMVTGAQVAVEGKGWWMLAYAAVFFPILLQLLIEVWPSRLATMFLSIAISAYLVVAMFELGMLRLSERLTTTICHSTTLLAAHLGVLVCVLAYARYVYLEAHSQLTLRRSWLRWPHRGAKGKSATSERTTHKSKQMRVDEPHANFGQEAGAPPAVTLKTDREDDDDDDELPAGSGRKLSKAERRRLRKEAKRI